MTLKTTAASFLKRKTVRCDNKKLKLATGNSEAPPSDIPHSSYQSDSIMLNKMEQQPLPNSSLEEGEKRVMFKSIKNNSVAFPRTPPKLTHLPADRIRDS
ncbi:hypothetical protein BRADI_1g05322v3 [Brachypodium distachyon]|uniref:Uncharacterized protein n=1 Tax=Brachypodium distachyon TaxID=15368 RepID=A0A2K2DI62_BRADI|nr:hypothetical protein BRADI_1g05322v3 [Brachypodium distachyon]